MIVMSYNGFQMPVYADGLKTAEDRKNSKEYVNTSVAHCHPTSDTQYKLLSDVIPVYFLGMVRVISVGDVALVMGTILIVLSPLIAVFMYTPV